MGERGRIGGVTEGWRGQDGRTGRGWRKGWRGLWERNEGGMEE